MRKTDFDAFHALLTECLAMWDKAPSARVSAIWFRTLSPYSLDAISDAFTAHMRDPVNGKFEAKPAHIIEQIERAAKADGRPGPEEAWAISLTARSEDDTVVWTTECAQAWGAAKPVMDMGDEVGARMAFREAYTRLVAEARARGEASAWEVSEGFDVDRRRIAVTAAIEAGRIPPGSQLALERGSVLLLGVSQASGAIPPQVRARLSDLRQHFAQPRDVRSDNDAERQALAQAKAEQAAQVDRYMSRRA